MAVHDMVQRLVLLVQTTTVTAERGHGETEESLVLGRRGGGCLGLLGGSSRRCRMQERVRLQVRTTRLLFPSSSSVSFVEFGRELVL